MTRPRLLDLPHGFTAVIDEADWPRVERLTLYRGTNGYVYFSTWHNGKSQPQTLHSFLLGGAVPGHHIDHVNGDKLDIRRANLRVTTPSLNQVNRRSLNRNNRSGARGIHWRADFGKWIVQITHEGKNHYLGSYSDLDEAKRVRRSAELSFFGELCP